MERKNHFKEDPNSSNKVNYVQLIIITLICSVLIYFGNQYFEYDFDESFTQEVVSSTVVEIISEEEFELAEDMISTTVTMLVEITTGEHKGMNVQATQSIDPFLQTNREIKVGDEILISNNFAGATSLEEKQWSFTEANRIDGILILVAIFFALILIIGRGKGVATILSLVLMGSAIFLVFIPAILSGVNIYAATIVITIFIIFASLSMLNGFNKKTLCAIVGNIGGVLASGVLAFFVNIMLKITGLIDIDYIALTLIEGVTIDLVAIVWAAILIGSLGAIMDVSMSISSAMNELSKEITDNSYKKLIVSGMNIGKDIIGTMTNTLILAYVGSSLAIILLIFTTRRNLLLLFNMELIVVEIVQALVGSIGILLCVPITVFICALVFRKKQVVIEE